MNIKYNILRDFYGYSGPELVKFGTNVGTNLDPVKFPNLMVAPADILTQANDLNAKLADTITGGTVATAAKNKAFDLLTASLDANANIVEVSVNADLELLLSTGYLPASTNRVSSALDSTMITALENNGTTKLLLRLAPMANARMYQVQLSTDAGKTWTEACLSSQARRIVLNNLTPGTVYYARARCIGGSTGASDWSGSSSIMCT
jgi:hypothetical protein